MKKAIIGSILIIIAVSILSCKKGVFVCECLGPDYQYVPLGTSTQADANSKCTAIHAQHPTDSTCKDWAEN